MHALLTRPLLRLFIMLAWCGLGFLAWSPAVQATPPRLKVAATIFPLYDLVRQVAGPAAEVMLLLPPGASPHTFTVRPKTLRALAGSRAIFAIGHGLDDWATRLAREAGVRRTITVDAGLSLRPWHHRAHGSHDKGHGSSDKEHSSHNQEVDPHYWLAIPHAVRMVQTIAESLGQLAPTERLTYQERATAYTRQLQAAERDIRELLADFSDQHIATFHPAFDYFAAAYGLHIAASFEPSPGQEPAPRQIEGFLRRLKAHRVRVLFVEPQLPGSQMYSLARDFGVRIEELDPLGGAPGRDSYIAMMRFNASQIASALRE